jgi:hypothetical protein
MSEINLTVYDSGIAHRVEEIFQEDLKYSQQITYEQWRLRSIFEQFVEFFRISDQRATMMHAIAGPEPKRTLLSLCKRSDPITLLIAFSRQNCRSVKWTANSHK